VGVPLAARGDRFEEHLAAMRACREEDPVEQPKSTSPNRPVEHRSRIGQPTCARIRLARVIGRRY
jgi:hypothetical protein